MSSARQYVQSQHNHRPPFRGAVVSIQQTHSRTAPPRAKAPAPYTFGRAGRQLRLGPIAFWTVVGTLVIMAGWSLVTATYFAFREDVLTRLIARKAEMQYAYEDHIAELRAQVDRLASHQLLDQEQFEQKLDQLVRRESSLEARAAILATVRDTPTSGSVKTPVRNDRKAQGESIEGTLKKIQSSLDRVETKQTAALGSIEQNYDAKARRMRSALTDLGLDADRLALPKSSSATGGPFVPATLAANAPGFEHQLLRIDISRSEIEHLARALGAIPVRKPVVGEIDTTSGFGVRMDPFLHVPAMHTGLDFRGDIGEPIYATATGIVTHADWMGGYGRMVEINHGNGLATRYGHLSAIDVKVGDKVRIGQVVGRLGTSGRSTGPHLHYETRIDGEAVDPEKFLHAGFKLDGLI